METVDWDKRYREGFYDDATGPSPLLERFWGIIPRGPVADIAMGNGRNALFLAGKGHRVFGIDRSWEALKIAKETMAENDLYYSLILGEAGNLPLKKESMAGVIVFYFLLRNSMKEVARLLQKKGVLIYETFLKRQNVIDRHRNPDLLLDDGELISYFADLDLLFYEETIQNTERGKRATARFVGRKR